MDVIDISLAKLSAQETIKVLGENKQIGVRKEIYSGDYGEGVSYNFLPDSNFENKLVKKEDFAVGRPDAQSYLVTWDGKQYNINDIGGWASAHWLGNAALADSSKEDTGEPFLFISDFANNVTLIIAAEAGEHTYNLDYRYYVYKPIDPKYLPGVCLPVVELSISPNADGVELTAEESAKMDEVAVMGLPIVCKHFFKDMKVSIIMYHVIYNGQVSFAIRNGEINFTITKIGDTWVFVATGGK